MYLYMYLCKNINCYMGGVGGNMNGVHEQGHKVGSGVVRER